METRNPDYRAKLERAFSEAAFVAENGIRETAGKRQVIAKASLTLAVIPPHRQS